MVEYPAAGGSGQPASPRAGELHEAPAEAGAVHSSFVRSVRQPRLRRQIRFGSSFDDPTGVGTLSDPVAASVSESGRYLAVSDRSPPYLRISDRQNGFRLELSARRKKGRALHGIERTMVTLASARNLIKGASGQSGTDVETLRRVHVQGHSDEKCELADAIELERET